MHETGDIAYVPATATMRPQIIALLHACELPVEDLPADLEHFFVAVTVEGDRLIGTVGIEALEDDIALFRSLAVVPHWRGRGVARRLFESARSRARQIGARELFLLTTTAEAIFARWGFLPIPRQEAPLPVQSTPEYRTLCPGSAVVMHVDLPPNG